MSPAKMPGGRKRGPAMTEEISEPAGESWSQETSKYTGRFAWALAAHPTGNQATWSFWGPDRGDPPAYFID